MASTANDTPPSPHTTDADSPVADLKRKREDQPDLPAPPLSASRTTKLQKDILHVLESHDTQPSFLKHSFASPTPAEPATKKPKLSGPNDKTTIASKLSSASYSSLRQIKIDAHVVADEIVSSIRTSASEREGNSSGRPSAEELKQIYRIQSLEDYVEKLADEEIEYVEAHERKHAEVKGESGLTNGHTEDAKSQPAGNGAGTVLTLFGNAPTPKQLFSSMQNAPAGRKGAVVKSELPVEEMSLPTGITATKILPMPADDSKKAPTFEETFAPPYSLPTLQPPKAHKRPSTRDLTVTWEFKDPVQRNNKRGGYTVQSLTVGNWLGYGRKEGGDADSTREKRKQRDRALSSSAGEAERLDKASLEESLAKEEEALFRRAYSSYAPTCDNSNAIIPEETKNVVWWHKVGSKRYNDTFAIDPALLDQNEMPTIPMQTVEEVKPEDENFDKILEDLDELDNVEVPPETAKSKTEVEQVLRQVSELIETLASHQRIRNATLASSTPVARTPISPAPIAASKIGKPDEPSEEEVATYNSLTRELAYLILKLPPYAVAKLDGDQLADLGVSKLITLQPQNIKGVMEEDHVTRQAKMSAIATASSIATLARPNSSAGQHYNTTAQRTPAIGQAANTRYGQSYGPRTPATQPAFNRQTSNPSYGTPAATAPRPTYGQPNQYARPGATAAGYGQANGQQYYQRPQQTPGGYGNYSQGFQQTPGTQQRFGPQQAQQQRAANAVAYQTNPAQQQLNRTASPAKAAGHPAVSMAPQGQRPLYAAQPQQPGSGRATPTNYPSQPHTPINGYSRPPPPGIAPRPASSTPQPPQPTQMPAMAQTNGTS
ncbi:hypothetical protein M409DRAFT_55056 [Zasmidium cellare ATCC 36951]|uniref:Uncharacterized protein n=1 Tax=Zasmidium cellare ATCC 36951 TaxID=1080233 RepID=A0A6A6CJ27_ZASCE|nr:uncharacterized protein M409DRAFT_55056 [Zasmidium cellare ATCC 36951]KAF2166188.1 hypothetical protein M409DRAFT_55056 [Zasmidium cellare ATCC 36951]